MYTKLFFTWKYILPRHLHVSKWAIKMLFSKGVISVKWRNKLLIHNINLTGHGKSACGLRLLVFLEIWVISPFWHWRSQVFPKGYCHHDLKAFFETGYNNVLYSFIENMKLRWLLFYLRLLFTHIVKGHWRMGVWNQK